MNNLKHVFGALLSGETLIDKYGDEIFIEDGELKVETYDRLIPQNLVIKQKPKWYDNIPESGVLCWVSSPRKIRLIMSYDSDFQGESFFEPNGECYNLATPLTTEEISKYYNAACWVGS